MFWKAIIVEAGKDECFVKGLTVWNLWKNCTEPAQPQKKVNFNCFRYKNLFEGECLIEERIQGFSVNFCLKFPFLVGH